MDFVSRFKGESHKPIAKASDREKTSCVKTFNDGVSVERCEGGVAGRMETEVVLKHMDKLILLPIIRTLHLAHIRVCSYF